MPETSGRVVAPTGTEVLPEGRVLRLQPGDTVVFELEHNVTSQAAQDITQRLKEGLPGDVKVLVVVGGKLKVVRDA